MIERMAVPRRVLGTNTEIDLEAAIHKMNEIIDAVNAQTERADSALSRERANTKFAVDHIHGK